MAKVTYSKAHNSRYGYTEFENYSVSKFNVSSGVMTLKYNENLQGLKFDIDRSPFTIKIEFSDLKTYKPSVGPFKGQNIITSGEISSIKWLSKSGATQVKMEDIGLDAGDFHYYLLQQSFLAYENLVGEDSLFVGPFRKGKGMDVTTGSGDDVVRAKGGGSFITDNGGSDRYVGTAKWDTVNYSSWNLDKRPTKSGVQVNLKNEEAIGPDGETDTLIAIDQVFGTNKRDILTGDTGDNVFAGLRGNDVITGGNGFDRAQYFRDANNGGYDGIRADLGKGVIRDGFGTTDKVRGIEFVEGTREKDTFIGNNANNTFRGHDKADRFVFKGNKFGTDRIMDFDKGEGDKINIVAANKLRDLDIEKKAGNTHISLNDDSEVVLVGFTGTLDSGDFIF